MIYLPESGTLSHLMDQVVLGNRKNALTQPNPAQRARARTDEVSLRVDILHNRPESSLEHLSPLAPFEFA